MLELSEGIIQPHELRKFIIKRYFEPHRLNPFIYFSNNREEALEHLLGIFKKIDKNIFIKSRHLIDAFCLDSRSPANSVLIQDRIIIPLGFTPHGIRNLSKNNRQVVIDFLYKRSRKDIGIYCDLVDIFDAIGLT